jgi:acetoin:2,6-dichlorophenolindophenol oxidoreductase subunit beta
MKKEIRKLDYKDALAEGLLQAMEKDKRVFVMGEGVDDSTGIFGTTLPAHKKFPGRVMDMPLSEALIAGAGTGAAISGMRPVMVFARSDFSYLAMDQIANHAAIWPFMSGGSVKVPWVLRMIVGRGWGNGAQHSQSLQALFAHIPGLKVVMPASAYEAKGLLISAIENDSPVISIEHRSLYHSEEAVPEKYYSLPLERGRIARVGKDITLAALSFMVSEAQKAATILEKRGIDAEIINISSIKPLDEKLICKSVKKTKRVIVLDTGWKSFGVSAEISALINEKLFGKLKSPVRRIALPDSPVPAGPELEKLYYPSVGTIVNGVLKLLGRKLLSYKEIGFEESRFQGPF